MTDPERRPWYAAVCCPSCYGPVRVRLWEREGRCRGCRPKRQHSQPRKEVDLKTFIKAHNSRAAR